MAKYLKSIYVSGWQCSSTASTTNEPGPDFADYPANTVPAKVEQLFKAQLFHDQKQSEERARLSAEEKKANPYIDYITPILADADAGFGGTTSLMKTTKLFILAGASGIHIEDQVHGTKKCGHMAGKVIVSTRIMCNRLIASRLQADICLSPLVICARTDALSAKYIDSNIDSTDHPYILGCIDPLDSKKLDTFPEAGVRAIKLAFLGEEQESKLSKWNQRIFDCSIT